jgi:uncharacterized protein (DUF433 family)
MDGELIVEEMTEEEFEAMLAEDRSDRWEPYIHQDPRILVGKPVIRGTRISVELILDLFGAGWSMEEVLDSYPHLSAEQVRACFAFAHDRVREEYLRTRDMDAILRARTA